MSDNIVPARADDDVIAGLSPETITHYAALLTDFKQAMSAHAADAFLGVDHGTVKRAYLRGEIEAYRLPDQKNPKFTPMALARWLETHCRPQDVKPLPG